MNRCKFVDKRLISSAQRCEKEGQRCPPCGCTGPCLHEGPTVCEEHYGFLDGMIHQAAEHTQIIGADDEEALLWFATETVNEWINQEDQPRGEPMHFSTLTEVNSQLPLRALPTEAQQDIYTAIKLAIESVLMAIDGCPADYLSAVPHTISIYVEEDPATEHWAPIYTLTKEDLVEIYRQLLIDADGGTEATRRANGSYEHWTERMDEPAIVVRSYFDGCEWPAQIRRVNTDGSPNFGKLEIDI